MYHLLLLSLKHKRLKTIKYTWEINHQPGWQGDIALFKDGLHVNQDWCDACHLLQETHPH